MEKDINVTTRSQQQHNSFEVILESHMFTESPITCIGYPDVVSALSGNQNATSFILHPSSGPSGIYLSCEQLHTDIVGVSDMHG